jgi:polyhydroxyalkanoate synthesis repressor PhaR
VTRVVRRYGNRKLYDTQARRYVTLDGLRRLVASGHDVQVVDQATGEDLTALTLAQVILDGVRERTARIPRQVLAAIVRLGAGTASVAAAAPARARRASQDAERIARRVMDRLSLDEAVALRQEIADALQSGVAEAQHAAQARLGELARQLERQAADHPVLATIGSWLAGFSGEETRRTSWRRREGPPRGGARAAAARRRPGRPASARSPRSGSAGMARSARSRRRTPSSGGRSSR